MRVLFIDNDRTYNEPIIWRLEREGHQVSFAQTVEEALPYIEAGGFDVALLDIMMPPGPYSEAETEAGRATGVVLLRELERKCPAVPVVFLTVRRDEEIRARVVDPKRHPSVKAFLEKPATPTEVISTLQAALQGGR